MSVGMLRWLTRSGKEGDCQRRRNGKRLHGAGWLTWDIRGAIELMSAKANYGGQIGDTTPVGSYPANDYGLYDMVGNVMEWCLDAYETEFYARSPRLNPIAGGVLTDIVNNFQGVVSRRAIRSGCWYNVPLHVRVTDRYGTTPDHVSKGRGFRCVQNVR